MAQIGNQYFVAFTPGLSPVGQTLEDVTRAGVDGVAYRKLGRRGEITQHQTKAVVTLASGLASLKIAYKAMQATLVTVIENGNNYPSTIVLNVGGFEHRQAACMVGGIKSDGTAITPGQSGWILTATWTLQYGGV